MTKKGAFLLILIIIMITIIAINVVIQYKENKNNEDIRDFYKVNYAVFK